MPAQSAADLPEDSVVVGRSSTGREVVCIKNHPTVTAPWRCTDGSYSGNWFVDVLLDAPGGAVLRVGDGAP